MDRSATLQSYLIIPVLDSLYSTRQLDAFVLSFPD